MHFLIDADLPRSTAELIQRHGHTAFAQREHACLLTGDFGFADIRNYDPQEYAGIAVLSVPRDATAPFILRLIEAFLQQTNVLARIDVRLAIVEPGGIRLRPQ